MKLGKTTTVSVTVVAAGALVVGLALPAAAREASTLINGKSIAKHSISGDRLENNTITGAQVKESTLAAVPNASKLGGVSASGYAHNIAFEVTTKSTSSFSLMVFKRLGAVKAQCHSGNPETNYENTIGRSIDMSVLENVPGDTDTTVAGPSFSSPGNLDYTTPSSVWRFQGVTSSAPFQSIDLTLNAYATTGGACTWGVSGTATDQVTR